MAFANVWDVNFPPDTQLANLLGADIRQVYTDVQQRMASISGLDANKPPFQTDAQPTNWTGMLFFATDTSKVYQFNGATWVDVTASITNALTGEIRGFAGAAAPTGWLLCDHSAVSRTTYAGLFNTIGTAFGAGDGSTTFNVPDGRGRVLVGAGAGPGLTNRPLGGSGGEETHVLATGEMPVHSHGISWTSGDPSSLSSNQALVASGSIAIQQGALGRDTATIQNAGGGAAHNNMQPWLAVNYIIKF